jgi:MFS family permease
MPVSDSTDRQGIAPRLIVVIVLLALSLVINYVDRGNLSIAAPMLKDELKISGSQLGLLLSAFFWTYACLNLVCGWLVDRFDVNLLFAGAFVLWSVATAATGLVHGFATLFVLRLLLGAGESVAFPSYNKILALNFNEEHRGIANSTLSTGLLIGPGVGLLFGGFLMGRYGWRPFFIVLGLSSILWIIPWLIWMPRKHYAEAKESVGAPNLVDFFLMRSAWGTCFGLFFANYANYFLITWLPYFLVREHNFSMNSMAKIGGAAYLLGACASVTAGWISDRWLAAGASLTRVRKTVVGSGIASCGIFLGFAGMVPARYCPVVIILAVVGFGVMSSSHWAISQTLAGPSAAGRWVGFQNFFGNLSGIIAPAVTGYVLDRTGHFYWAFLIAAGVGLASAASFVFLIGPIQPVIWDRKLRAATRQ